jgi:hypothetical protein
VSECDDDSSGGRAPAYLRGALPACLPTEPALHARLRRRGDPAQPCNAPACCRTHQPIQLQSRCLTTSLALVQGLKCMYPQGGGAGAIEVTALDLPRLDADEFLNDTVIDFYIRRVCGKWGRSCARIWWQGTCCACLSCEVVWLGAVCVQPRDITSLSHMLF